MTATRAPAGSLLWCRHCRRTHLPPLPQPARCRRCRFVGWLAVCPACGHPILTTVPTPEPRTSP